MEGRDSADRRGLRTVSERAVCSMVSLGWTGGQGRVVVNLYFPVPPPAGHPRSRLSRSALKVQT